MSLPFFVCVKVTHSLFAEWKVAGQPFSLLLLYNKTVLFFRNWGNQRTMAFATNFSSFTKAVSLTSAVCTVHHSILDILKMMFFVQFSGIRQEQEFFVRLLDASSKQVGQKNTIKFIEMKIKSGHSTL